VRLGNERTVAGGQCEKRSEKGCSLTQFYCIAPKVPNATATAVSIPALLRFAPDSSSVAFVGDMVGADVGGTGVGAAVGIFVGIVVGMAVGMAVGIFVGSFVGMLVGILVGSLVGMFVGIFVGVAVGIFVGIYVGVAVGIFVGMYVGILVGANEAPCGNIVGMNVGILVGIGVGCCTTWGVSTTVSVAPAAVWIWSLLSLMLVSSEVASALAASPSAALSVTVKAACV
jgi:hypothetical protein